MSPRLPAPSMSPATHDSDSSALSGDRPLTHAPVSLESIQSESIQSESTRSVKRTRRSPTFTSTPEPAAPQLLCPDCDRQLAYRQTVISGIKPIERWDYFECRTCGSFVYRERTRKLRRTM